LKFLISHSRVFLRKKIKSTFREYKNEQDVGILKIQLERSLKYLNAVYELEE
jgi:hypothetical protein